MTNSEQKNYEKAWVRKVFRNLQLEEPDLTEDRERPDFLLEVGCHSIALEHTDYDTGSRSADKAWELFSEMLESKNLGGPFPAYTFYFRFKNQAPTKSIEIEKTLCDLRALINEIDWRNHNHIFSELNLSQYTTLGCYVSHLEVGATCTACHDLSSDRDNAGWVGISECKVADIIKKKEKSVLNIGPEYKKCLLITSSHKYLATDAGTLTYSLSSINSESTLSVLQASSYDVVLFCSENEYLASVGSGPFKQLWTLGKGLITNSAEIF